MKRMIILSTLLLSLVFTKHSVAGEIVDTEWLSNVLTITYSPASGTVECTAYNSSGNAIGGGRGIAVGSVARIIIVVPNKYAGKDLKLSCR